MIEGDSEEYNLLEEWTKDFDCQGYYSCEIGVRKGFSSKIIMDNVQNNFLHIGVDPYGDRKYQESKFAFVMLDGPHTTNDVLTEAIWFANKSAPHSRIVFDDWITYDMTLIRDVMKYFGFHILKSGTLKVCLEKK